MLIALNGLGYRQLRLTRLNSLITGAGAAYDANSNRSTRNHITSVEKNRAFGELKHFLSLFINYLEGNEMVPDDGLKDMHLRPRTPAGRQPLPVPVEAPMVTVARQHDELTVYVTRIEHGQPADGVQLKPYHGFKLRWKFEDETKWRFELSTRLHYILYFDRKDEGRRVILSVAWVNTRLHEGPWTEDMPQMIG